MDPVVVDLTCGFRQIMHREVSLPGAPVLCDLRIETRPDLRLDFTATPFRSSSVHVVLFDPPHVAHKLNWQNSNVEFILGKFGAFESSTDMIRSLYFAWREIERILVPGGSCFFKWSNIYRGLDRVLQLRSPGLEVKDVQRRPSRGPGGNRWESYLVRLERVTTLIIS